VYSLTYRHDGSQLTATVGERGGYYPDEVVMAIVAFPGLYLICSVIHGYWKVGDTPMVGERAVLTVEDFQVE
jgi:hypothetical protein